jgi:hypothetical protein
VPRPRPFAPRSLLLEDLLLDGLADKADAKAAAEGAVAAPLTAAVPAESHGGKRNWGVTSWHCERASKAKLSAPGGDQTLGYLC